MYLCIYIATHLHMVCLDWPQAVLESNSRWAWRWRSSDVRDTVLGGRYGVNIEIRSWRPWSSELGDALGGQDQVTQRCTWRTWSCELEGGDQASMEMHLEAKIKLVWRYTWRPRSSNSDALADRNRASLEMNSEAMIKRVWRRSMGVAAGAETLFMS